MNLFYLTDWLSHWTVILSIASVLFCWKWVAPRFGCTAAMLLGYVALSSVWVWIFRENRYATINPYDQMALRYFSADSIAKTLLVLTPLMLWAENREMVRKFGATIWGTFATINCLMIVGQFIKGCARLECGGVIGNPSISMGATVCMLPVFIKSWRKNWFIMGAATIAVFAAQSSIAVGLLAVYAALWLFPWGTGINWKTFLTPVAAAAAVFTLGAAKAANFNDLPLLHTSHRLDVWKFMFDMWSVPRNILFGTGNGTYHVFSINLQNAPGVEPVASGYHWNTMHNEPLQMLFEGGVVGLLLFSLLYFAALTKIIDEENKGIAISLVLFGLYSLVNPSLHFPIPALFGAWLFVYALRREKFNLKEIV